MKTPYKVLVAICLLAFSLPACCQHFFDSAGHLLITAKGKIYYDSEGREIGKVVFVLGYDYIFEDASGATVVEKTYERLSFNSSYKVNPWVKYTSVYDGEAGVYSHGKMIGYEESPHKVYDFSGHELGYYDADEWGSGNWGNATMIYFLLLPNWGGRVP